MGFIMASAFALSACSGNAVSTQADYAASPSGASLRDADFEKGYDKVTISGNELGLPCSYAELEALGIEDTVDAAALIKSGTPMQDTVTLEDGTSFDVYLACPKKEQEGVYKKDSEVISIFATQSGAASGDFAFYKGITFASTKDDVAGVLDLMEEEDGNSLYGIKLSSHEYFSVSFAGDAISDIMVINAKDYFE